MSLAPLLEQLTRSVLNGPFNYSDLLIEGTLRFRDLLKSLDGISPKTLSLRLKELEYHGIVERKVFPEVPPRVEYTLTEKGERLESIFIELKDLD